MIYWFFQILNWLAVCENIIKNVKFSEVLLTWIKFSTKFMAAVIGNEFMYNCTYIHVLKKILVYSILYKKQVLISKQNFCKVFVCWRSHIFNFSSITCENRYIPKIVWIFCTIASMAKFMYSPSNYFLYCFTKNIYSSVSIKIYIRQVSVLILLISSLLL